MNLLQNFVHSFGLNLNNFNPRSFNPVYDLSHFETTCMESNNMFKNNEIISSLSVEANESQCSDSDSNLDCDSQTTANLSPCLINEKTNLNLNDKKESFFPSIENKRIRNMFSTNQIEILEKVFEQTHYPDATIREQLSMNLNLNVMRIQVWFQNRRAKYRKMDVAQRKSETLTNKKIHKPVCSLKLNKQINIGTPSINQSRENSSIYTATPTPEQTPAQSNMYSHAIGSQYQSFYQNPTNLYDFQMVANQQVTSLFPHLSSQYQTFFNQQQTQLDKNQNQHNKQQNHHYQSYLQ